MESVAEVPDSALRFIKGTLDSLRNIKAIKQASKPSLEANTQKAREAA